MLGQGSRFIFPSVGPGMAIASMALSELLSELGIATVPHGFRSSVHD